jgi:hypothetical protein
MIQMKIVSTTFKEIEEKNLDKIFDKNNEF